MEEIPQVTANIPQNGVFGNNERTAPNRWTHSLLQL